MIYVIRKLSISANRPLIDLISFDIFLKDLENLASEIPIVKIKPQRSHRLTY